VLRKSPTTHPSIIIIIMIIIVLIIIVVAVLVLVLVAGTVLVTALVVSLSLYLPIAWLTHCCCLHMISARANASLACSSSLAASCLAFWSCSSCSCRALSASRRLPAGRTHV
jgi:hypothetical protein